MRVYMGIDCSQNKHDIVFLNQASAVIAQLTVPHTQDGFLKLNEARKRLGIAAGECVVGLETAHTPEESVIFDQVVQAARLYLNFALSL